MLVRQGCGEASNRRLKRELRTVHATVYEKTLPFVLTGIQSREIGRARTADSIELDGMLCKK